MKIPTTPQGNASPAYGVPMALLKSMRLRQWYKNLLIYLAFFFTISEVWHPIWNPLGALAIFANLTLAVALFCLLSSAVYIYNDIRDIESDRQHPRKRYRPIAAGRLPLPVARIAAAAFEIIGILAAFALSLEFGLIAIIYIGLQFAYSHIFKHIPIVDVFTISSGMVLRVVAGAVVMEAPISPWLYLCTTLVALLLALVKRRSELRQAGDNAHSQRSSLIAYSTSSLDQLIVIAATASLVAYSLYTFTAPNLPENKAMMLTIPFVVFGLFRYILLADKPDAGESPEDYLLSDIPLAASLVLWVVAAAVILTVFGR